MSSGNSTRASGRPRRAALAAAAVVALGAGLVSAPPSRAATDPVDLVVDGNDIRADNVNGLTYKGLGILSCNSTSNLLMDYKAEHPERYWQLIRVMFGGPNPLINHVKVEMGSDTNTSTGADPATMRTRDELADASRSPGFQLAADAKTVNPRLKVSVLRWEMPQWVQTEWNRGAGTDDMYRWYKETILDVYQKYGYMVDYVNPDKNETGTPDVSFIKWYKNAVTSDTDFSDARYGIPSRERDKVAKAYHAIKIVASDENTSKKIGPALLTDSDLFGMVDAVGYHYNTDDRLDGTADSATYQPYTKLATGDTPDGQDKEVWYSEGTGSFGFTDYRVNNNEGPGGASTGIGGVQSALDIANRVVKGYANSKRTHYVFQPAIGSFYEGAQYSHKELVSARDPWSGYLHYDAAIYVMQHFTQFAKTGWENSTDTAGIWRTIPEASRSGVSGTENVDGSNGAPSYMTLADPAKKDFSTVVVNDSDQPKTYRITARNLRLGADTTMEAWETRAADPEQRYDADFKHLAAEIRPAGDGDGTYTYTYVVQPRSITTLTTLDKSGDAATNQRLPRSGERAVLDTDARGKRGDTHDGYLYADDFGYAEEGRVRVGTSYQPYLASRGNQPRYMVDQTGAWEVGDGVLYQYMDQSMKDTAAWNKNTPNTTVGDFRWENYKASVDVSFPDPDGGLAALGVRQQKGMAISDAAYNLRIGSDGAWTFYEYGTVLAQGTVAAADHYRLAVEAKGATVTASVDGKDVATYDDPTPQTAGRVKLGSDFHKTGFDNLKVEKVAGYAPYATAQVDNMDSSVAYDGDWSRKASYGDAMDWYRSTSTSTSAGASVTVPFRGTGLDVIGGNDGSAVLDVYVDDRLVARNVRTAAVDKRLATYTLRGLPDGKHEARFVLTSGKLVLDAFDVASGSAVAGPVDTAPIRSALTEVGSPAQGGRTTDSWALFARSLAAARAAADGQKGLDTVGAGQIADRLRAAYGRLESEEQR
ncbi:GH59 galactosidase [Streptomyces sp. VRA16 Mangrove soil]|uniref:GH59 galactosidase n=1 Tax=Streptomyces sp. VRA16 Mangrove soil TaxID=2817434 RepID=UPI001A9D7CC9|nr:GH59 galactosidase [Streptomyces sp. VRA16 Mangrove soil]MBO1330958.1 GH59 galactosidase [Streptomyces sp. VRA16 Mangrove soil]